LWITNFKFKTIKLQFLNLKTPSIFKFKNFYKKLSTNKKLLRIYYFLNLKDKKSDPKIAFLELEML